MTFYKKSKYNNILNTWKMIFQTSDFKEKQFLELLDDDFNVIELSQAKGGPWLKISWSFKLVACMCYESNNKLYFYWRV